MIKITKKEQCCGCHSCVSICPRKCITLEPDTEGFLYPKVNKKECINCGLCLIKCPLNQHNAKSIQNDVVAFSAKSDSVVIRKGSSSGGIFYHLAKKVIGLGGLVIGASFNNDFSVSHKCIEKIDDLHQLMGSKYVQSEIGRTFLKAKELLDGGRVVYFSGTPCQIFGLRLFLGKDYSNLLTQDIICHGVPSNAIWLNYFNSVASEAVNSVSFRDKKTGWRNYSVTIGNYSSEHYDDPYFNAFLKGYILRPSCYSCKFKSLQRQSDFTLGDFWGSGSKWDVNTDDLGTSLVLINTKKGLEFFTTIGDEISFERVDFYDSIKGNPSYSRSTKRPRGRDSFVRRIRKNCFCSEYKKIMSGSKIKALIRRLLKRGK